MKKGWQIKKLSEVCEKITDGTHQTPTYFDDGVLFLSSRNVTSGTIDWENVKYIDEKQHGEMQRRVSPRLNDILLAKNGTTGVAAMVDRDVPFDIYVSLALLRPLAAVRPTFLLHFINSPLAKQQFTKRLKGIGVPNLHLEEIREVEIPLPPLAEQQRIVGLLDEAFEGLATAKANAEKNLQNARALFESHLQSVFTQRGPGWVEKNLGDLCQIKTGKKDVNEGNPDGKYPFFTCAAAHTFSDNYSFDTEALLVAGNGNVGQVSYYSGKFEANQRTYVLFDFKGVTAKYLFRVLDKRLSATVSKQKLGNTMPYIKIGMLTDFVVPVPPPKEQELVAESLGAIADETQRLARLYERKHAALEALKKSLLHQAFTGAL